MKHCKKYETHNDYITAKKVGSLVKHNVSYCQDNKGVHYDLDNDDYSKYLGFKAIDSGTFTFKMSLQLPTAAVPYISYSVDGGESWVRTNNIDNQEVTVTTPIINKDAVVIWKSEAVLYIYNTNSSYPTINNGFGRFSSSGRFNVYGNIMSLMYGDDFENKTILKNILDNCNFSGSFGGIFYNNSNLVSASNLILPATTLNAFCYYSMFNGCRSLTTAPELPAITLADSCYNVMFLNCTSLTTAPELPATTLANSCYGNMFYNCSSLTRAPELPATTLATSCYSFMFNLCSSLTAAPELPATTLADWCYLTMFLNCTALTVAPELPATTLAQGCYAYMFLNCSSLTRAPELPATTLAEACYSGTFAFCSRLNYIKAMFTTTPSTNYTLNWVGGVSLTGTFVKNTAATWNVSGNDGIPTGWTVQTATA